MNKLALISGSIAVISLVMACTSDPVYIERRLPLPLEPSVPPIRMQIGDKLTVGVARDITIRDYLLQDYIARLRIIIKSTWEHGNVDDN